MRFSLLIAALVGLSFFSSPAAHAADEIPFAFRGGMIWLKVSAEGQVAPLNFLLDSGASASVLDLATARRCQCNLGKSEVVQGVQGRCTAYRVENFVAEIGAAEVSRSLLALDLSAVSAGCGRHIDGLLGADFFHGRIVQIDFAAEKIRLLTREELSHESAQILPIASRRDALCVRVAVDGHAPAWMRLDTGCSAALEWVANDRKTSPTSRASIGATTTSGRSILTEVAFGSEHFSGVKTGLHGRPMFSGEAGLLGNGLLSRFRLTVDLDAARLLLRRID